MKETTYQFHVQGMHCNACSILITETLSEVPDVTSVQVHEAQNMVRVVMNGARSPHEVAKALSTYIAKNGYSLSVEKKTFVPRWNDFRFAAPFAIVIISLFVFLQKMGIVNLITADKVTIPTAFGIGLVASVSSCLALVGGLLLSVSAQYAKEGEKGKPQMYFHLGRLISFFVFGGVIGLIGSAFTLNGTMTLILGTLVGLVMLSLGINLLDIFPWAKKLQPRMPAFLVSATRSLHTWEHDAVPILIGASTFFLPCGFTQSMQVYSLSTGSFMAGALTMTAFALGTLPVLALISFGSVELGKGKWSGVFFKTAGLLVIVFGIINILNSFAGAGITPPLFGF